MAEGWGFPTGSRKAHYFVDGRSLCRKWMYLGGLMPSEKTTVPSDCVTCARRLVGWLKKHAKESE